MKRLILFVTALILTGGCLCCSTDILKGVEEGAPTSTLNDVVQSTQTTIAKTESSGSEATETTIAEAETTQTTLAKEETTQTTLPAGRSMAECLKKKNIDADEVVFLYTTSCCASLESTVLQLGSYKFSRIELGIRITSQDRDVLTCLGLSIEDVKDMQAAQLWCPASGERMVIDKTQFIGAKDRIRDFAIKCREKAVNNG